jgi:uncharacterized membrane protein YfcA
MPSESLVEKLLSVGGIAGVIAVVITAAICFRYVQHGAEPIPDILTYALSTIIGFYFGAGVAQKISSPTEPPHPVQSTQDA